MASVLAPATQKASHPPVHRTLRRVATADWIALGAIALLLAAEAATLTVGIDDLDEGYFAEQAWRVFRGELPYRDFQSFYTPGLIYLHALAFDLLDGPYVVGLRIVALLGRAALAFGTYALARTHARPAFAALAPLFLLVGLDTSPIAWQPHPGWLSSACAVAVVIALARLPLVHGPRRTTLLFGAGVLVALAFLFKQNTGAYMGLAATGVVLLQGGPTGQPVTPALRGLQAVAVAVILAGLYWLMRPFMDLLVFAYLLAPLVVLGALMLVGPPSRQGRTVRDALGEVGPIVAGFLAATLPWLVVLVAALGGHVSSLASFVGAVNQAVLYAPLDLPDGRAWTVAGLAFLAVGAVGLRGPARWAALLAGLPALALAMVSLSWDREWHEVSSLLQTPGRTSQHLVTLFPPLAAWAGLWLARRPPASVAEWQLRWYLLGGGFLLLTQYPRLDAIHLAWSAPALLAVGGIVLARAHRELARRWALRTRLDRAALFAALAIGPAFAASTMLYLRAYAFVEEDIATGLPRRHVLGRVETVPAVDRFLLHRRTRDELEAAVAFLRANTAPGEPIFVYPTAPLLYVAADRPNPTRFAHLYPGAATPAELAEVIATLESQSVHVVVVNDFWLDVWKSGSDAELARSNLPLEQYFDRHYRQVEQIGATRFLLRVPASG